MLKRCNEPMDLGRMLWSVDHPFSTFRRACIAAALAFLLQVLSMMTIPSQTQSFPPTQFFLLTCFYVSN